MDTPPSPSSAPIEGTVETENTPTISPKKSHFVRNIIILGIIALGGYTAYAQFFTEEQISYETQKITRQDIDQIVSVTGKVSADPQIDLNFRTTEKIASVLVEVNDEVKKGDILAMLDNQAQTIALNRAKAELQNAQAELDKLVAGSTQEEIQVAQTQVENAENDLKLAELEIQNIARANQENIRKTELAVEDAQTEVEKYVNELENIIATGQQAIKSAEKDVASSEANLSKANTDVLTTAKTTEKGIQDTYEQLYPIFNNSLVEVSKTLSKADNIIGVDNETVNDSFELYLGALEIPTKNRAKVAYERAEDSYRRARISFNALDELTSTQNDLTQAYQNIRTTLIDGDKLMNDTWSVLENSITSVDFTQTDLNALKDSITTQHNALISAKDQFIARYQSLTSAILEEETTDESLKAAVEIAQQNLSSAQQRLEQAKTESKRNTQNAESNLKKAQNALTQAEQQLSLIRTEAENSVSRAEAQKALAQSKLENAKANLRLVQANPRDVDLNTLKARIEQYRANVEAASFELGKTLLISPTDGIVAKVNIEEGETYTGVTATETGLPTPAIIIIAGNLKVEADVSETDIAKLNIGDEVSMTFDAFPISEVFKGKVTHIDPSETLLSGVVYYRIEAEFDLEYGKIKSGMTANLDILTDSRTNVLTAPIRGVIFEGKTGIVRILNNGSVEERTIELGLESDLYVEVVSGVDQNEDIVLNFNGN